MKFRLFIRQRSFFPIPVLDCGPLDDPENGRVSFDDTTVGEVANYNCNSGYVLNGDSQRKCQSNGRWSGDEPVCISTLSI